MTECNKTPSLAAEPMIDARHAAYVLNLPHYWFSDPKFRAKQRIPHYRLGALVRFRLSELEAWWGTHRRLPPAESRP